MWLKADRTPIWSENSSARGFRDGKELPVRLLLTTCPGVSGLGPWGVWKGLRGLGGPPGVWDLQGSVGASAVREELRSGPWGIWGPARGFAISVASGGLGGLGNLEESGGTSGSLGGTRGVWGDFKESGGPQGIWGISENLREPQGV